MNNNLILELKKKKTSYSFYFSKVLEIEFVLSSSFFAMWINLFHTWIFDMPFEYEPSADKVLFKVYFSNQLDQIWKVPKKNQSILISQFKLIITTSNS
jgi:hypothetical protein